MANLVSTFDFISDRSVPLEFLSIPSIDLAKSFYQATSDPTWMDNIITYLKDGKLPQASLQARRIQYQSAKKYCSLNEEGSHLTITKKMYIEISIKEQGDCQARPPPPPLQVDRH